MAKVYVGSCNPTDFLAARMHVCKEDIPVLAADAIIEVTCDTVDTTYGQYVYILPQTPANAISLCEVEVYGDEGMFAWCVGTHSPPGTIVLRQFTNTDES